MAFGALLHEAKVLVVLVLVAPLFAVSEKTRAPISDLFSPLNFASQASLVEDKAESTIRRLNVFTQFYQMVSAEWHILLFSRDQSDTFAFSCFLFLVLE